MDILNKGESRTQRRTRSKMNRNHLTHCIFTMNPLRDLSVVPHHCQLCSRSMFFINRYTHRGFGRCRSASSNSRVQNHYSILTYRAAFSTMITTDTEIYDKYHLLLVEAVECSSEMYFRCPVCLDENSKNPLIMGCGHCLCLDCYSAIYLNSDDSTLSCPVCRFAITHQNVVVS